MAGRTSESLPAPCRATAPMSSLKCPTGRERRVGSRQKTRKVSAGRCSCAANQGAPLRLILDQWQGDRVRRPPWAPCPIGARRRELSLQAPHPGVGGGRGFICSQSAFRERRGRRPMVRRLPGPRQIRRKRTDRLR